MAFRPGKALRMRSSNSGRSWRQLGKPKWVVPRQGRRNTGINWTANWYLVLALNILTAYTDTFLICFRSQLIDANKVFQEKFATNNNNLELQTTDKSGAGTSRNVENNNRRSSDLIRLTQQRELLLKSGAYRLTDEIIRALDTEIEKIRQKLI